MIEGISYQFAEDQFRTTRDVAVDSSIGNWFWGGDAMATGTPLVSYNAQVNAYFCISSLIILMHGLNGCLGTTTALFPKS